MKERMARLREAMSLGYWVLSPKYGVGGATASVQSFRGGRT